MKMKTTQCDHISCLLCKAAAGFVEITTAMLRDDSFGGHKIGRCCTCGHVQLFPLPNDVDYYQVSSHTHNMPRETFALKRSKSSIDTARRVEWVCSTASPGAKVLDVGCGYGFVIDALTREGYEATGLDISQVPLTVARAQLQGVFRLGEVDESFVTTYQSCFEVVTMFHVLEHVHEPVKLLKRCFELVRPNGWLLVEVPNVNEIMLKCCSEYRAFYWRKTHLSYFDATRLGAALHRAGWEDSSLRGVQRYGLGNLLHWLREGEPQLPIPTYYATNAIFKRLEQLYRTILEHSLSCDTLIAEARKRANSL